MIQIIAGEKGKGKTKIILDRANADVLHSKGSIIYIDKNSKHMYELNNKIRLINAKNYFINNADEFVGFISGIISQNYDISSIYLDSFLTIACIEAKDMEGLIDKLEVLSSAFKVDFILSVSSNADGLSEKVRQNVVVAL
ncbi:MAG: twitching motility protein PilT [Lachnospiraceae bacterium]|nr:twitching motility protein PilT [Lachnospiraceae bacterium]